MRRKKKVPDPAVKQAVSHLKEDWLGKLSLDDRFKFERLAFETEEIPYRVVESMTSWGAVKLDIDSKIFTLPTMTTSKGSVLTYANTGMPEWKQAATPLMTKRVPYTTRTLVGVHLFPLYGEDRETELYMMGDTGKSLYYGEKREGAAELYRLWEGVYGPFHWQTETRFVDKAWSD